MKKEELQNNMYQIQWMNPESEIRLFPAFSEPDSLMIQGLTIQITPLIQEQLGMEFIEYVHDFQWEHEDGVSLITVIQLFEKFATDIALREPDYGTLGIDPTTGNLAFYKPIRKVANIPFQLEPICHCLNKDVVAGFLANVRINVRDAKMDNNTVLKHLVEYCGFRYVEPVINEYFKHAAEV